MCADQRLCGHVPDQGGDRADQLADSLGCEPDIYRLRGPPALGFRQGTRASVPLAIPVSALAVESVE